jgi:nucleotide-binding universal stress UspA family protein
MYRRIMVPIDGSEASERGLREAIGLVHGRDARLCLLHVVDGFPLFAEPPAGVDVDAIQQSLRARGRSLLEKSRQAAIDAGAQADTLLREVLRGRVADIVVDEASKAGCDLIVMGTHGRRGLSRLALGSDAETVARSSPVPVLLVRNPEASAGTPAA